MTFTDYLNLYWHSWILDAGVLIVIISILLVFWRKITKETLSHMVPMALFIWFCGLVLYCIGFAYEGSGKSLVAYFFRSVMAATEMFISNNELIEVSPVYKENGFYMICFSIVHLCAVCLSAIFILQTVGFRIRHSVLVFREARMSRKQDRNTYFFWGINDQGIHLAKDIRRILPEARIIFIRTASESGHSERVEMSEILNISASVAKSIKMQQTMDDINDALVVYTSTDVQGCLKSQSVRTILQNTTVINFFFLGDDEMVNVKNGSFIYSNSYLSDDKTKKVTVYTVLSHGGKNRVLQDRIAIGRMEGWAVDWKFIDSTFIGVSSLKRRPECHPVSSIPESSIKNGAVDTQFTAVVIGFGKTGQEMFKFLGEFSSFVGTDGKPIRKNIVIADKNINSVAGPLCMSNPAIFHTDEVKLISKDPGTVEFWREVKPYADTANCISIALGSDEKNIEIAMDLYAGILQYRVEKPQNIKIFIKSYRAENQKSLNSFASIYNAQKENTGIEVIPFGGQSDIFTCDVVMGKDANIAAKMFNYQIGCRFGKNDGIGSDEAWLRDFNMTEYIRNYKAVPLAIGEMTSKILQRRSSFLFIGTLLTLAKTSIHDLETLTAFVELGKTRDNDSTRYKGADSSTQALMDNLARCAHLRLSSGYWMLGYRYADSAAIQKDLMDAARQKLTDKMVPLDKMTREDILRSYALVDISFIIAQKYCKASSK